MQPLEIDIAAVHDVEGTRLGQQQVEHIDVVQLAIADVQKRGDVATQVQQRVQFHRRFCGTKRRPWKHRQAQVDGTGIERVDRLFQVDPKGFVGIQPAGDSDQRLGQGRIDTPVAHRIRVGQGVARHAAADTQVIKLGTLSAQTRFDVPQALPISKLRKGHAQVLIEARERFDFVLAPVTHHTTAKRRQRQMLHNLREHQFSQIHRRLPRMAASQDGKYQRRSSNRDQNGT